MIHKKYLKKNSATLQKNTSLQASLESNETEIKTK